MTTEQAELSEAMEVLQRDAGIPHLPTPLTYELRLAVGGNGPRAYDWSDKPHRLVYEACSEVERLTAAARVIADDRAALKELVSALRKQLAERDGEVKALLEALEGIAPYLDAIVCFASALDEHEPNRLAKNVRHAIARARGEA